MVVDPVRVPSDLDFATVWERVADAVPTSTAIVQGARRVSYDEFDDQSSRFAAALESAGIGAGDSVGLLMFNCPEYLIAQHGAFKQRAVPVNVNFRYLDDELAYLLSNGEVKALVYHDSLSERVDRVRHRVPVVALLVEVKDGGEHLEGAETFDDLLATHEPQPRRPRSGDDLYMLYTGGTTGNPKGVMFRQWSLIERIYGGFAPMGLNVALPTTVDDVPALVGAVNERSPIVALTCCPLMHGNGMWLAAMRALLSGGTVILLEGRSFDASEAWSVCEREHVTEIVITGDAFALPMLRTLKDGGPGGRRYDLSSLRLIVSAGAIWSVEIKEELRSYTSAELMDRLGSTEAGAYAINSTSVDVTHETASFALLPGTKVVDEHRLEVLPGERGVLAARTAAFGYFKDVEKTEQTFFDLDGSTYVFTGDWVTLHEGGMVSFLGRGSNCINTGGEKVYAEEVEEAIKRHPSVDDALVLGLPDERFGEQIAAVVASPIDSPPSGDELREWLRMSLSHFKVPKTIVVLEGVRRAANGKADYAWAKIVLTHERNRRATS